jgi:hypothetical protein
MAERDPHCDGCGREAAELYRYKDPRIVLLLCWDCWKQLHQPEPEQPQPIPEDCRNRLLFYRWLHLNGKISEGIEEPVAA